MFDEEDDTIFDRLSDAWDSILPLIRNPLRSLFTIRFNSKASQNEPVLINYIWINKAKASQTANEPVCAIELGNIKSALRNANKYPAAKFNIWVDKNLLDDYSIFCLESFIEDHARHNNVTLRNLQEIPDYAGDPHFVPLTPADSGYLSYEFSRCGPRNVYSRADYARILVLEHCLANSPEGTRIIYSDTDCPDLRLPEALRVMDKHGVAIHDFGSDCVSHGYIGIATDNDAVRKHFGELKSETRELAHADDLGFRAFAAYLEKLGMPNEHWHNKIGLPRLLPRVGKKAVHVSYTPKRNFEAQQGMVSPAAMVPGEAMSAVAPSCQIS